MYKARRLDGSTIDVSVSGKPVFDPNGRFLGYRGVATDVSDTVRANKAERALQDVRMELARVSRITSLGALTASIAHEINQPIAAVIMNASAGLRWLGAEPPNLEEVRQVLERIRKDGTRAGDVIGRIRALARKTSGQGGPARHQRGDPRSDRPHPRRNNPQPRHTQDSTRRSTRRSAGTGSSSSK